MIPRARRPFARSRCFNPIRRGIASVLAMLYLMLFSAMALGFYAQVTMSAQTSASERQTIEALAAAQSGVHFIRYHLSAVSMPPALTSDRAFEEVGMQLCDRLNPTTNFIGNPVYADSTEIRIPDTGYVMLDNASGGHKFRLSLRRDAVDGQIVVTSVGVSGSNVTLARGIEQKFSRVDNPSTIWGYGVATKGALSLSGGIINGSPETARGSILVDNTASTAGVTMSGSASISASVSLVNSAGTVSGSGSIGGTTNPALWPVTRGIPEPEYPTVDPTPYINYLATQTVTILTGSPSVTNLDNVRIKANANPTFKAGSLIRGVILVESPNKVTIPGGSTIQGVIVANTPSAIGTNQLVFSGGSSLQGVETLPASFGALTTMTGASILAPNFAVSLSGGSTSFGGSIVAGSLGMSGGSGGSVAGSIITMTTLSQSWTGGSGFTITNFGPARQPVGVSFTGHYDPVLGTYLEVKP